MSTSLIYHAFECKGYLFLKNEYKNGSIYFHIKKDPLKQKCAVCGSNDVIHKGLVVRELQTLPIGNKPVYLVVHLHRLACKECGSLRLEPILIADTKKHWTKVLGRYIVDLLKHSTVEDVAQHLGMSWDTVKEIHLWALRRKYPKRKIGHLKYLGVDEVAIRKRHYYMTVVVDLETGEVVWVAPNRVRESFEPFLKKLKGAGAKIKAIAMDMWPAYFLAVMNQFSPDVIVFDRFHLIAHYNKMLDEFRRSLGKYFSLTEKNLFVGVRYLLLQGKEKLQDDKAAQQKLEKVLSLNQPLNIAYQLKEELRELWSCTTRNEAELYLSNWINKAQASGVRPLLKFSNFLKIWSRGILNYFDHPITTGKVEGINNKIKVLKRQAYGFRDLEYFSLRIYALHEARYSLIG